MEPVKEDTQSEPSMFEDVDGIQSSQPGTSNSPVGKLGEENLMEAQEADDVDDNLPKSSAENIIPLEKLKNGWMAVSGFMMSSAQKAKATAVEAYNSESVTNFKRRTSEATISAWEKTVEVATPALEKTYEVAAPVWTNAVESATYAAEKARENAIIASETITHTVQEKWKQFNHPKASEEGVEINAEGVTHSAGDNDNPLTSQSVSTPPSEAPTTTTGPPTIV